MAWTHDGERVIGDRLSMIHVQAIDRVKFECRVAIDFLEQTVTRVVWLEVGIHVLALLEEQHEQDSAPEGRGNLESSLPRS